MHIVMLSDHETRGGAAIAASRLAGALKFAGQQVTRIVFTADQKTHIWQTQALSPSRVDRLVERFLPDGLGQYWLEINAQGRLDHLLKNLRPDVINVHGLHGAAAFGWSPGLVEICAKYAPVIWTLHDMWSFSGRCAYSDDCRKFLTGCDAACPTPNEYPALPPQQIATAWRKRQELFAEFPALVAVSPSRWLAREAQAGLWAGHRVEVIPNGLPLDVYQPIDREGARRFLGLKPTGPVLLISARRFNRHKGRELFFEALKQVTMRPLTIMIMGQADFVFQDQQINFIRLGYVDSEAQKALIYSAADLFVHPALNDNLPNVVMEALACGTPVVAFPIGGIPDMVRPNETGWLAEAVSARALAKTVETALKEVLDNQRLNLTCRIVAKTEYSDALQAQRYMQLGASLLKSQALLELN
jgi:glycosyltransferase involved in cell wall biosynthesis